MKKGNWSIELSLMLDGKSVHMGELSETTREYIVYMFREGFLSGDFIEDDNSELNSMNVCPSCGAAIDPKDGEEDGYGKLHLYWECSNCGTEGTAVIDLQHDNAFIEHQID